MFQGGVYPYSISSVEDESSCFSVETPEGPACGLIKAFALGARVTLQPNPVHLKEFRSAVVATLQQTATENSHYVLFNGEIVGHTDTPEETANVIRSLPPPGEAPYCSPSILVCPCDRTVCIHTEEGRVVRPLLCVPKCLHVHNVNLTMCLTSLMEGRFIRYVDAAEVCTMDVALNTDVMHERLTNGVNVDFLEVHAYLMLGVTAGLIPLLQTNQSPRNAYQTSMEPCVGLCVWPTQEIDVKQLELFYQLGHLMGHQHCAMLKHHCVHPH